MDFCSCLSPASIDLASPAQSKKKILETLAEILSTQINLPAQTIFQHLLEREKLGSTALGKGIAVPHCRIPDIDHPIACLLRTQTDVDYDAPDNAPVSLFFALLVPEEANDEHLKLLGELARKLNNPERITRLKKAPTATKIIKILQE